jgi:hypothetical protein
MLAMVGIVVQQAGIHVPGDVSPTLTSLVPSTLALCQYADLPAIAGIELATFNQHYGVA